MIDWLALARELGYADVRSFLQPLYAKHSILQLAERFGASPTSVRSALLAAGVPLQRRGGRGQGGRPPLAPRLTLQQARALQKEGVAAAARRLGVPYETLYSRIHTVMQAAFYRRRNEEEATARRRPSGA